MKMKWNNWLTIVLAVWLLISPWVLGFYGLNLVVWNNLLVGSLTVIFVLWNFSDSQKQ